ncbi:MAG: AAA family ATPase [Burkholderiaceae bacterium]
MDLTRLNVFVGANNAGKTSLLNAIELFLRSSQGAGRQGPLAFEAMSSFASFDSVLRRHWSPSEQRPTEFKLEFELSASGASPLLYRFSCKGRPRDNTSYVAAATYRLGKAAIELQRKVGASDAASAYSLKIGRKLIDARGTFFQAPHRPR